MSSSVAGPLVNLSTSRSADIDTDVLFLPVFEGEEPSALLEGLSEATVQAVKRAILGKEFQAKPYELFILPVVSRMAGSAGRADRVRTSRRSQHGAAASSGQRGGACRPAAAPRARRSPQSRPGEWRRFGAGNHRRTRPGELQRRSLQERRARRSAAQISAVVVDRRAGDAARTRAGGGARPHPRRVVQHRARSLQRAVERADAVRVRRPRRRNRPRASGCAVEILDEDEIARLGMGLLLGVARGSAEPPRMIVLRHDPPRRAGRAGARAGRQGHHLRHRRHLDQAGRRHGADEGRHGRRRRGRSARMRAIALLKAPDPRHRRRADDREHARRPGDQAGRRPDRRQRQDGRGHQHRRRRPADSRRRALVRAAARRHAPGRRRHADRRLRRRARPGCVGPVRSAGCVGRGHPAGRRSAPAIAAGRCRSTTSTPSS